MKDLHSTNFHVIFTKCWVIDTVVVWTFRTRKPCKIFINTNVGSILAITNTNKNIKLVDNRASDNKKGDENPNKNRFIHLWKAEP